MDDSEESDKRAGGGDQLLFHFQNSEIAKFTGVVEDRFIWATDADEAAQKLENVLSVEPVEWIINNFVIEEVKDEDGNIVERRNMG